MPHYDPYEANNPNYCKSLPQFTTAGRPAAGSQGRVIYNTTTNTVQRDNGTTWDDVGGGGTAHNILSSTHSDTTVGTVVRGDLVIGTGATPTWSRLAVGTSAQVLVGGTEPSWATTPNPTFISIAKWGVD